MVVGAAALAGLTTDLLHGSNPGGSPSGQHTVESARSAVRDRVADRCQALAAAAVGLAVVAASSGESWAVTPVEATGPWVICGVDPAVSPPAAWVPTGLAARAEIRDASGAMIGYAYAVQPLNDAFLADLSAAAGARVRLVAGNLGPYPDQPLPLDVAVPSLSVVGPEPVRDSWPLVLLAIGVALLADGLLGWWMAGIVTRPLRRLVATVDRVATGDLSARSHVSGTDETGRLGRGIDLMIADMEAIQRLSVTDALTGLGNVRHLADQLRLEIERAGRFGRALGVLALDLDHFKEINDRYGHRAGDSVLIELAARLRRAVRGVDLSFRSGGEEFVVLLPETDIQGSLTAAHRIGDAVRDTPFSIHGPKGPDAVLVTASIGVAVFPRHARTGDTLLEAADQALYAAKEAGRNTFVLAGVPVPTRWAPDSVPSVVD
jgi:diguanylate cyclase (GGDEF)-like protein